MEFVPDSPATTDTYPLCVCESGDDISVCRHPIARQGLPGLQYTPETAEAEAAHDKAIDNAVNLLEEEWNDLAIIYSQGVDDSIRPSIPYFQTEIVLYTELWPGRGKKGWVGRVVGPRSETIQGALKALAQDTSTKLEILIDFDEKKKKWLWKPLPPVDPGCSLTWRLVTRDPNPNR